jgi:sarcosine oxidase subunit beta
VRANSRDARELPLARLANRIWPLLHQELGADLGYERIGGLELFERAETRARAAAQVVRQRAHGIASELLDASAARALEPGVGDAVLGAVLCPEDGIADHTATTRAYAAAAERAGARVLEGRRVERLHVRGGRVRALEIPGGEAVEVARTVILLANAACPALLQPLAIAVNVFPVLPQVLFTAPHDRVRLRHLIGHLERRLAAKDLDDGRWMISGGWLGELDGDGRGRTVDAHVAGNLAEAAAVFPALAGVALEEAQADRLEAVGPELVPIIDRAPGIENLLVGTGWTGHGFAIGPAVARLLAAWLLDGRRPVELEPFGWR